MGDEMFYPLLLALLARRAGQEKKVWSSSK
jgi:hypothetical protein